MPEENKTIAREIAELILKDIKNVIQSELDRRERETLEKVKNAYGKAKQAKKNGKRVHLRSRNYGKESKNALKT